MLFFPYCHYLESCNPSLGDVVCYLFYPGMEFGSKQKWWPDTGVRPTPHEGIDFCYYCRPDGCEGAFTHATNVPVMADGTVFAVCSDFLGQSVFVDHHYNTEFRFLSIYAHIVPKSTITRGFQVKAGQAIGAIADTSGRKNKMPAHLHLSCMQLDRKVAPDECGWGMIHSRRRDLIDPLPAISGKKVRFRHTNHWKEKEGIPSEFLYRQT
ncbi:MAG: peptidoglycan DD-metalloendopeptidase family protein [Desulfopila sp.]